MANSINKKPEDGEQKTGNTISRKNFFKYAGASMVGAAAIGLYGCGDDEDPMGPPMEEAVYLGTGDVGILNYAYALEQLEAAFYIMATDQNSWMQEGDGEIFEAIRDHEIAHRDWFSAVIGSVNEEARIPGLTPNFSTVDFSDRNSVLGAAQLLEDTGVTAYNGAGHLIENPDYLVQAGKIVSVEARHASSIRGLIQPGSFYGSITAASGLDAAASPADILAAAGGFIDDEIDASGLPQPANVYS
ncbi:ferritin-like domain-containing protein [Fodinibius salsisoli]|uniref:Ferritin-like domain-containing protein n=1 Tax=Fodinibius salsisoli TaxID=2820877 RepID=A0ABT3PJI7_9BACT|nr:ferritin-like domain-containing protein [Fodinibius salsisoli]MCW9705928.1 ferritin-like domain-containing protein [Fodinibius salsisoli]